MSRPSLFNLAALLGAAGLVAACAGTQSTSTTAQAAPAQSTQTGTFTDAQVASFVTASQEIEPISSGIASMTEEQRAQATVQIQDVLERHGLTADVYNAIAARARTDEDLANRIAAVRVANVTDAQLQAFVSASAEIDPLNRSLATAAPEQRQQIATQIRAILDRNNLDLATYNGIAARAQTDQALAARIAQLRASGGAQQ